MVKIAPSAVLVSSVIQEQHKESARVHVCPQDQELRRELPQPRASMCSEVKQVFAQHLKKFYVRVWGENDAYGSQFIHKDLLGRKK